MTTQYQKNIELIYAEKVAELLNEPWEVEPSPDEISWPDLVVTAQSGKFGLEVRELYFDEASKGSANKAKEKVNLKTIQKLAAAYYKKDCIPVKVDLLGDITERDKILSMLTKEVPKLSEMEQKRIQPYSGCVAYLRRLPNHFREYRRWNYVSDKVGWVRKIDKAIIDRAITIKSKNLKKYQKNISDISLLLVSDRTYNSGKDRLENEFACNRRGFKNIYYFSYPVEVWCIGS